ncbi:MAG: hypothetical protein ACRDLP_06865 [Solirubrobacteraceae bacterium]
MGDGDFAWDGSPSEPAAQPPPARPRSRVAPLLAAVAIAAVVTVALVMASGRGTTPRSGGPVALAAAVTSGEAGFRVELAAQAAIGGRTIDFNGSGSVSERQPLSATMTMSIAGTTTNEIVLAPYVYVQAPGSSNSWFRASLENISTDENPAQTLATLRAAGSVTRVGAAELDGVPTTHYHAVIDLTRVADAVPAASRSLAARYASALNALTGSADLPTDVWIDAQNRVRRVTLGMDACTREGHLSESVQVDYSDFGPQPPVSAPPADRVSELPGGLSDPTAQLKSIAC